MELQDLQYSGKNATCGHAVNRRRFSFLNIFSVKYLFECTQSSNFTDHSTFRQPVCNLYDPKAILTRAIWFGVCVAQRDRIKRQRNAIRIQRKEGRLRCNSRTWCRPTSPSNTKRHKHYCKYETTAGRSLQLHSFPAKF